MDKGLAKSQDKLQRKLLQLSTDIPYHMHSNGQAVYQEMYLLSHGFFEFASDL